MQSPVDEARNLENNGGPNHLAAWRKAKGLSQKDLALMLGTTVTQLWFLEHGVRKLTAKWLRRISKVLDVPAGVLLDYRPDEYEV